MVAPRRRESPAEKRAKKAEVDDPNVVLEAGLRFLEARPRSIDETRRRLTQAGYREELITGAIERLADIGMLDDEAFAQMWVESRDRASPRGEHALMLELRQKGIDATIVSAVLKERREAAVRWDGGASDAAADGTDEPVTPDEAGARKLLARQERALLRTSDPRVRRQKAYALLARRGFAPDVARDISREWAGSLEEESAEG